MDVVPPSAPQSAIPTTCISADLSAPGTAADLINHRPDLIYHLAAIVSGEAEADFDKGYRINLDGTRYLFDAIRAAHDADGYCPKVVFSSSIAVFGGPYPDVITDTFFQTPQTSYGTQKLIGELLLQDYTRRGIMNGIALRLPTICIRPGAPNKAASGFFSNIMREPLVGRPAVLPVPDTVCHSHASPRITIQNLIHAGQMDLSALGHRRGLNLPGCAATVAEQIEALRTVAGNDAVSLIRPQQDAAIMRIVSAWPQRFQADRALGLGFAAEKSFQQIIQVHLEDELG
ncbi:MAG TPA: D-erythronate dehydrogenase [Paracoccaceae bacterium]|nr:D-erythronate dehydrogenase [Paracoccaceae bacterium]